MLRPGQILEREGFGQGAYFDVRIFHPNASKPLPALFRKHKQAKKRDCGQHIREVEHGVFTPPFFSEPLVQWEREPPHSIKD